MKNLFYPFIKVKGLIAIFLLVGILSACNSTDKKIADKTDKTKTDKFDTKDKDPNKQDKEFTKDENTSDTKTEYVNAICNCMDGLGLSSRAKKIIIKAGNSNNPRQTISNEINNIDDATESEKVSNELASLKEMSDDPCFKKLDKKYPQYKDADMSIQKKLVAIMEDKCEVAAALYKIGQKGNGDGMGIHK